MLGNDKITRRDALVTAGAVSLAALVPQGIASGQRAAPLDPKSFQPKKVSADFFLTLAAVEAAKTFRFGKKTMKVSLETSNPEALPSAIVKRFELPAKAAKKLSRKENVVESVVCGITDPSSIEAVRARLTVLNVPKEIREQSVFFFALGRRRLVKEGQMADALKLSKQHKVTGVMSYIIMLTKKGRRPVMTVLLEGDGGAITVDQDEETVEEHREDGAPPTAADCVADYMREMLPTLIGVGIVCTGCAAAVAVAGAATPTVAGIPPLYLAAIALCGLCMVGSAAVIYECSQVCPL